MLLVWMAGGDGEPQKNKNMLMFCFFFNWKANALCETDLGSQMVGIDLLDTESICLHFHTDAA